MAEADIGSGDKRSESGWRKLVNKRHFLRTRQLPAYWETGAADLVKDKPDVASFIRFWFAENHRDSGRTRAIKDKRYRYVRSEYWTHFCPHQL
jgi:hypothetical protein